MKDTKAVQQQTREQQIQDIVGYLDRATQCPPKSLSKYMSDPRNKAYYQDAATRDMLVRIWK